MVRFRLRRVCAVLALVGVCACADDGPAGPVCTPIVAEPTVIRFPVFAPGSSVPFANARVRQDYVEFQEPGCPALRAEVHLRFEPLGSYVVQFNYRLDYASNATDWFYVGSAGFNGAVVPTNDVLVSLDPDPIERGSAVLSFQSFTAF